MTTESPKSTLPKTSAPAQRAMEGAGYFHLEDLTKVSEVELLNLHGMGPKAIRIVKVALEEKGFSFAPNPAKK